MANRTANTTTTRTPMSKKMLRVIKKTRKLTRRLRKLAIKADDTSTLAQAEKMIEIYDKIIADQKKLRDAQTANEKK